MKVESRNCPNCGAPIPEGEYRCEYCGTTFRRDDVQPWKIYVEQSGARVLKTRVAIPDYYLAKMKKEDITKLTLQKMKNDVADALMGLIEIRQTEIQELDQTILEGRIRVLEPTFRFWG